MKHRNWFWGVFFLAAGFFVVASQVGGFVHLGFWSIAATIFLAAAFIASLVNLNFFGILVSAALLYAVYQHPLNWPIISVWILLLTAILLSTGLSILFHGGAHRRGMYRDYRRECDRAQEGANGPAQEFVDGDDVSISESFHESTKYLHAQCLRHAHIASSFGALSVYFDGVELSPDGAEVSVEVSFGKLELYLPGKWRVVDQVRAAAGTVTNELRSNAADPDAPVLTLRGSVSFGNLEIRYV